MIFRKIVCTENITKKIKKLTGSMTRRERSAIWEKILLVMTECLSYLNDGYRMIDVGDNMMIKFSIEKTEPCFITMVSGPYIKIHLACKHTLSLMAIYGIVFNGKNDHTESILCPVCRKNLIPVLVPAISNDNKKKISIKSYKNKDIKTRDQIMDKFTFEKSSEKENVFETNHKDVDEYINEIFDSDGSNDEDDTDSDSSTISVRSQQIMLTDDSDMD